MLLISLSLTACINSNQAPDQNFKTMMIKSSGLVEVAPNKASLSISLTCLNRKAKLSKECLVDKSNALTEQLLAARIKEEDILTQRVSLNKSYSWTRSKRVFDGYQASTSLNVVVKDIEILDELYTALLENENLSLGRLSYGHTAYDSLKNEAYSRALLNSAQLCDRLLEDIPEDSREILQVGNVELTKTQGSFETKRGSYLAKEEDVSMANESNIVSINTGNVSVRANLFVEYRIE